MRPKPLVFWVILVKGLKKLFILKGKSIGFSLSRRGILLNNFCSSAYTVEFLGRLTKFVDLGRPQHPAGVYGVQSMIHVGGGQKTCRARSWH